MDEKKHIPHPLGYVAKEKNGIKKWIETIRDLFINPSSRRYAIIGVILLAAAVIPTVAYLGQQTHLFQFAYVAPPNEGGGTACDSAGGTCFAANNCSSVSKHYDSSQSCAGSSVGNYCCMPGLPPTCTTTTIYANQGGHGDICNGNQYCTSESTNSCSTHVVFSGCSNVVGKCGYTPSQPGGKCSGGTCTSSGTCKSSDGTISNNPGCTGGYICCAAPTPTPTPPSVSPAACQAAKGACTPSGVCKAEGGIASSVSCGLSGYVCCQQAPPTPTLALKCPGVCVPNNTLSVSNPPTAVCIGKAGSQIFQTQDCQQNGGFCCTGQVVKPTPVPLPNGNPCVGLDPNGKAIEKGVCVYQTHEGAYTLNLNQACGIASVFNGTGNINGKCPQNSISGLSCNQVLQAADGGKNIPVHSINQIDGSQYTCNANSNDFYCCAENSPPAPTLGPIDQVRLKDGDNHLCGPVRNGNHIGVCIYPAYLEIRNPYSFTTNLSLSDLTDIAGVSLGNKCEPYQSNYTSVPSSPSDCFPYTLGYGAGEPYLCCSNQANPSTQANACTSGHGVCNNSDSNHPYRSPDISMNTACSTGACYIACPANTDCSNGQPNTTPTQCQGPNCGGNQGPTCQNGQTTSFSITITIPGVGTANFANSTPGHNSRFVQLDVVDTGNGNAVKFTKSGQNYNLNSDGTITISNVNVGSLLNCSGTYKVRVKSPGSLNVLSNQLQYGSTSNNLTATLLMGDIVDTSTNTIVSPFGNTFGDNSVGIQDYNVVASCVDAQNTNNGVISMQTFNTTIQVNCPNIINFLDYQDGGTLQDTNTPSGTSEYGSLLNDLYKTWSTNGGNGQ